MMSSKTNPAMLSYLVVDDEAAARKRIVNLLAQNPRTAEVHEASGGEAAITILKTREIDVVFLDIQMPEVDGFAVVDALGADKMPLTIFVTAYDQHAIRAFEANALDYLLKPYGDQRFENTLARIHARHDEHCVSNFVDKLTQLASKNSGNQIWDRLVIKANGTTRFIRTNELEWIEAAGVYVTLHLPGSEILHRLSLAELASHLDPKRFLRVHRSSILNLDHLVQLESVSHGEFDALMKDGARIRISRTYRSEIEKRLGQSL